MAKSKITTHLKKRYGLTLVETLIVLFIFTTTFTAIFTIYNLSNRTFKEGRLLVETQQEARKVMLKLAKDLHQTSPRWTVDGTNYDISINAAGDEITFYLPVLDLATDTITALRQVRFWVGVNPIEQFQRTESTTTQMVADFIDNDPLEKPFFSFVGVDKQTVNIKIPIKRDSFEYALTSSITLRNSNQTIDDIPVEEIPPDGGS